MTSDYQFQQANAACPSVELGKSNVILSGC